MNRTRNFNVPFITNDGDLEEGEELIVEVAPKAKLDKKRNRTWRQVEQDEKTRKLQQSVLKRSDVPQSRHVAALLRHNLCNQQ